MSTFGNKTQNNNNQNNNQKSNPFQRSGSSRFGSNNNNNQNNNKNSLPPPPKFGGRGLFRRNSNTVYWTIAPLKQTVVRFDLKGLGDPLHRLLDTELDLENDSVESVAERLQNDSKLHEQLSDHLDMTWTQYNLMGAILLQQQTELLMQVYTSPIEPLANDNNNDEDDNNSAPTIKSLRAIDLSLVLNVLGRIRSNLLLPNTPLVLESNFLSQSWLSNDPRLVRLALATGAIEENWANAT